MSDQWVTEALGRHALIRARIGWRGLSSSEYTATGPLLVAGQHIDGGRVQWERCDHITYARYQESWEIALQAGDVILSKDGTIGRVARIDALPDQATLNGTMMLIRPGPHLNYRYLFHVLGGYAFKKLVNDRVSGSSIPHIFQRDMVTLPILLPPLIEQQNLAEVLDTVDEAIRKTEKIIAKLTQVKQGLLHDLLTRGIDDNGELRDPERHPEQFKDSPLGRIPKAWDVAPIRGLSEAVVDCPHTTPLFTDQGVLVARTSHIRDGRFDSASGSRVTEAEYARRTARIVPRAGDVIFTREAPVGEAFVVPDGMRVCLGQRVMLIRADRRRLDPEYLVAQVYSGAVARRIELLTGGTTNPHLNVADVRDFEIPVPQIDEQRQITNSLRGLEQRLETEGMLCKKWRRTKAGLMDDLLTGRVRVLSGDVG